MLEIFLKFHSLRYHICHVARKPMIIDVYTVILCCCK